jgi:hypothetical protein
MLLVCTRPDLYGQVGWNTAKDGNETGKHGKAELIVKIVFAEKMSILSLNCSVTLVLWCTMVRVKCHSRPSAKVACNLVLALARS